MNQSKLLPKAGSAVKSSGRSAIRSAAFARLLLRKQLWIWPIIAAILLGGCAWWVSRAVEDAMRERRANELTTILNADVAALQVWLVEQAKDAQLIANDDQLLPQVQKLLDARTTGADSSRALVQSAAQEAIRTQLKPQLDSGGYSGFLIISPDSIVLAADQDAPVGKVLPGYQKDFYAQVATGKAAVSRPFHSVLLLKDANGELKSNLPTMFAAAPLRDAAGKVLAVLALRIRPEEDFTRIIQVAREGHTGETYAFNREGLLMSESRFDDQLKQAGLLVDLPDSRSILTLELRDPGVDMTTGNRPAQRRSDQPLTRIATAAISGEIGVDVLGFRDYRGVPVIGAWTWLEDAGFGLATKQDLAEAFHPLYVLRRAFWGMFALLALAAVAIFVFTLVVAHANREARRAALKAQRLGQYMLDEKLGEGGMGIVYRAHHEMLQRPTAVKFLGTEKTNEQTIARFEREVRMTSKLTHPNTIAVYDYGRTPEGIFYYAMEYLEGINLEDLVKKHGPQPESRVIFILQQVSGSLAEAHSFGLIHRDIKPANIVLTQRGGLYDFVKLLDFGLVKAIDSHKDASLTTAGSLTGTPLYMPPEAIQREPIDARSDLYSLAAVGYFLLTGVPVFDGDNVLQILQQHVMQAPEPPSARLSQAISPALESAIMQCLAKSPDDRPASVLQFAEALSMCPTAGHWTQKDAQTWWQQHPLHPATATTQPETKKESVAATQMFDSTDSVARSEST